MKKKKTAEAEGFRIDPSKELCPAFDATGLKLFPMPTTDEMGFVVADNFPEEHIQ